MVLWMTRIALAADHVNLDEGLPVSFIDSRPLDRNAAELQSSVVYQEVDGVRQVVLEPRIEVGVLRAGQLALAGDLSFDPDGAAFREVRVDGLYALNVETLVVPALALGADATVSTEELDVDPTLRAVLTKSVPGTDDLHRFYANGAWTLNTAPKPGEDRNGYLLALGYGVRLTNGLFGLLGAVRELDPERAEVEHRAEVGFRASASPTVAVSLGTGVVLPPAELGVRPTAGFQVSF